MTGAGKRTWSRMGRERDEDSLTWNVFRYLERNGLLDKLGDLLKRNNPALPGLGFSEKVVYWSVDLERMATWESLQKARNQIGEGTKGSEPDIVVVFQGAVVLIEVKFDSASVTPAPSPIPSYYRDERGVFKKDLQSTAGVNSIGYELMRFFLLGEALKEQLRKPLAVISLTQDSLDADLARRVNEAVHLDVARCYARLTWGEVYKFIDASMTRISPRNGKASIDGSNCHFLFLWFLIRYLITFPLQSSLAPGGVELPARELEADVERKFDLSLRSSLTPPVLLRFCSTYPQYK
ncbi:MAG: hypothetical protein D9V47_11435 [Clostridia bacterium]|nr:MAG: hypothetical protein D9V47_11435 [Clostridia bacterium]